MTNDEAVQSLLSKIFKDSTEGSRLLTREDLKRLLGIAFMLGENHGKFGKKNQLKC